MVETQKNKDKSKKYYGNEEDKFLPELMNKVVICETLNGKHGCSVKEFYWLIAYVFGQKRLSTHS